MRNCDSGAVLLDRLSDLASGSYLKEKPDEDTWSRIEGVLHRLDVPPEMIAVSYRAKTTKLSNSGWRRSEQPERVGAHISFAAAAENHIYPAPADKKRIST